MIIDLICDRMDGVPYVARDFYFDLLGYGGSADITAAMDGGTNKDVQRALCEYIKANDYRSEICDYINGKDWLNDDKNERLMTTEQKKVLERCKDIFFNWVQRDFEKECARIIEKHNIQCVHNNYADAYPIFAAVLMDNAADALLGSLDEKKIMEQKRLAHKYMKYDHKKL